MKNIVMIFGAVLIVFFITSSATAVPVTNQIETADSLHNIKSNIFSTNDEGLDPVLIILLGILTWPLGLVIGILGAVPLALLEFFTAILINGYGIGIALYEMVKGFFVSIVRIGILWPYFLYLMFCVEPPF